MENIIVRRILAICFLNRSKEEDIAERLLVHSEGFGRQPDLASYLCKCGRPNWFAYPFEGSCNFPEPLTLCLYLLQWISIPRFLGMVKLFARAKNKTLAQEKEGVN